MGPQIGRAERSGCALVVRPRAKDQRREDAGLCSALACILFVVVLLTRGGGTAVTCATPATRRTSCLWMAEPHSNSRTKVFKTTPHRRAARPPPPPSSPSPPQFCNHPSVLQLPRIHIYEQTCVQASLHTTALPLTPHTRWPFPLPLPPPPPPLPRRRFSKIS